MLPIIRWTPSPNYSSRGGQAVKLIVIHDCEGNYAGSVNWFSQARSQVSAHLVLSEDGATATQMVAFGNKAWHACNFNPFSEGIEAAGFADTGLADSEWSALAELTAWRLRVNNLPPTWARGGIGPGFEQHVGLGAAGGGHHDITSNPDVWQAFVTKVQFFYKTGDIQPTSMITAPVPARPNEFAPSVYPRHDLQPPSLEWVQMTLNAKGYIPQLIVDGLEGWATQQAIRWFQSRNNLTVDGIAGPETVGALLHG